MNKRPLFLLYVAGFLTAGVLAAYAGTVTLTTYYPAPTGNYDQLSANNVAIGTTDTSSAGRLTVLGVVGNSSQQINLRSNKEAISNAEMIGGIGFTSNDNSLAAPALVASIQANANQAHSAGKLGTDLVFYSTDANASVPVETMRIKNGNVGIGVAAPTQPLDVSGNVKASGNAAITGSVTGGSFLYSSDLRLKQNILPITGALNKVQNLNGVAFTWRKNGIKDIGIVAQDVEKVLPEIVKTDANGMKSVEYGNLIAVLIEAVKEQQKQIEDLKQRLAQQESRAKKN